MGTSKSNGGDALLLWHRRTLNTESINRLKSDTAEITKRITQNAVAFQELALAHDLGMPPPGELRPYTDFDEERRARRYLFGGLAALALGVATFAALGAYSLNVDAPFALVFAAFA